MITINLKDFYYWYTQDEFIEVSDEVAAEMFKGKRTEKTHTQRMRRNKSFYSLDANDGIEASAIMHYNDSPERIFGKIKQHCDLCCALSSLPEIQGRRIEAYYIQGISQKRIAKAEGVCISSVNESIMRGLQAMKIFLENFENSPNFCPQSEAGI